MNRSWTDFRSLNGNTAGARTAFEDVCETLFREIYKDEKHVSQVRVNHGDGGIDIFIGELGVEPITVIQCKFFLDSFGKSQKAQIRSSFKTAISSEEYELKEWILCLPIELDIKENSWWFGWKNKQLEEYSKEKGFIGLKNGNELIDLFKKHNLYNQVFQIDDSLKIAQIHEAVVPKEHNPPIGVDPEEILFINYNSKRKHFYLERTNDSEFNKSLKINNIWLFGKSGSGKTALIHRNLIENETEYCFCDLSPVSVKTPDDVLDDILDTLEERFEAERNIKESNKIKQIAKILLDKSSAETVIVIDELSVSDDDVLKEIANKFMQLVTYYNNDMRTNGLRFIVSTISNPQKIVFNKLKASEHFQYICCDTWDEYLINLFDLLSKALSLELDGSKDKIIQESNNSPRTMKCIFKKIIVSGDINEESIDRAIKLSLEEIV